MSLNVLVVDDSEVMRKVIIRCLEMSGVALGQVHEAANGREGLDRLERFWIDLALIDINMPVMDGEEMIATLRRDDATRDLPVIVISTEGSQPRIARLAAHGVKFIHKPFSPEAVRAVMDTLRGLTDDRA